VDAVSVAAVFAETGLLAMHCPLPGLIPTAK